MKTRQEGIEQNSKNLTTTISALLTPGHPPSPKSALIARLNAEATAKTYDSTKDLIVLATSLGTGIITLPHGQTYTFTHNLGYIPIVQIVCADTAAIGLWVRDLTETTCTIFNYNADNLTAHFNIYCH